MIIIGAGPAGLIAALRLKQVHNISSTIYELRPGPVASGGAVAVPANGLRLLDRLGLYSDVVSKAAETPDMILHSFKGPVIGRVSTVSWSKQQTGYGLIRITRRDLMNVLLAAADKAAIQIVYGKDLKAIDETNNTVTALFSNGTRDSGDLLLGCDGIHSAVRSLHVDPECVPEYSGIANMFSLVETSVLPPIASSLAALHTTITADGLFGLTPATGLQNLLYWFFSREVPMPTEGDARDGWKAQTQREVESCKSTIFDLLGNERSEWVDMLRDVVRRSKAIRFYPIYKLAPGRPWFKGRCMLLGDAAHAMPPHAGQGVSMALEDVFLLSKLIESECPSLDVGLRDFVTKRKSRTEKMLSTAERNGTMRLKKSSLRLWTDELVASWALWVYHIVGLEKWGFGQQSLIYDVDNECF